MTQDPFAVPGGTPEGDPFAAPAPVGTYPELLALRGRLLLIEPTKLETGLVSAKFSEPGKPHIYDRMTVTLRVLDGGPIPGFQESEFVDMYLSQTRILSQCKAAVGKHMVLGRLDTFKPGETPRKGNPWGLADPTEADKAAARAYLANPRPQPAPVAQAAPQAAPSPDPWAQQAQAAPANWPPAAAPQPAAVGDPFGGTVNPFA